MAGAGKKTFTAGETLTASDVNTYLMEQSVMYFGGTAARASAIPTPSTGMTSYIGVTGTATIPQLETYTGSAWQTPYGLTQVANVNFSGVTTLNLDNVFTSAYAHYRIMLSITSASSVGSYVTWNSRNAGTTDTTSATMNANGYFGQLATLTFIYQAGQTAGRISIGGDVVAFPSTGFAVTDILNPALATFTTWTSSSNGILSGNYASMHIAGVKSTAAAHDGITLNFPTSSTGNIRIYGYRNS